MHGCHRACRGATPGALSPSHAVAVPRHADDEWTRRDLNPWPSRCKRDDLPLIYEPWCTQRLAPYNFSFLVLYLFLIDQQGKRKTGFYPSVWQDIHLIDPPGRDSNPRPYLCGPGAAALRTPATSRSPLFLDMDLAGFEPAAFTLRT